MAPQNILQIIQFLTESLSDSISELVLIAIVYQEKNAPVSSTMPSAINLVIEAANNFVDISFKIGTQGFQKFPKMKEKIITAATDVSNANKLLSQVPFNSPDVSLVWTSLVNACKALGSSSVFLLECVYNSQIERILECYKIAEESYQKIDFSDIPEKAQNFVSAIEDTNQNCLNFATFVDQHGNAQESPLMKEKLLTGSKQIISMTAGENNSTTLIDVVNKFLANYTSEEEKSKLKNYLEKLKKEISDLVQIVREASQFLSTDKEVLTQIGNADDNNNLKNIVEAGVKYSNIRKELLKACGNGDTENVEKLRNQMFQQSKEIFENTANQSNSSKKRKMMGYADEMEKLLPQQIEVALEVSLDPQNLEMREKLEEIEEEMQEYQDNIAGPNAQLSEDIDEELEILEELAEVVGTGDKKQVVNLAKKMQKGKAKIASKIRQSASKTSDVKRKERIEQCAQQLETLIAEEIATAQEILLHPDNQNLKIKLQDISDEIYEVLEEIEPLGAYGKSKQLLEDLKELKTNKNAKVIGKKLKKTAVKIGKQVRAEAKYGAVATRKKLENCVEELEELVETHITVCTELEENPTRVDLVEKIEEIENEISEVLSEITGAKSLTREANDLLEEVISNVNEKNQPLLEETLKRIGKTKAKIVSKARTEARKTSDPQRKKEIQDSLHQLEILIPKAAQISLKLIQEDQNETLLEELEEISETIEEELLTVASPHAILSYFENAFDDQLEKLETEANSGQTLNTKKIGKKLQKTGSKFSKICRAKAEGIPNSQRKTQILQTLDKIDKILPILSETAEILSQNPNDLKIQGKFDNLEDEMIQYVKSVSEPDSSVIAKQEIVLLKQLQKSVDEESFNFKKEIVFAETNRKLIHTLKTEARTTSSTQKEENLLQNAQILNQLIPQIISSYKEKNKNEKKNLLNYIDQSLLILEELSGDQTSIAALSKLYENDFIKLKNLSEKGDTAAIKLFQRKLLKVANKVEKQSQEVASKIPNKIRSNEISQAGKELLEVTEKLSKASSQDDYILYLNQSKDCIEQISNPIDLSSLIQNYNSQLLNLASFIETKDKVHSQIAQKRIEKSTQRIQVRVSNDLQLKENPEEKTILESNLKKFETLSNEFNNIIKKLNSNNNHSQSLSEISQISEQLKEVVQQFVDQEDIETTAEGLLINLHHFSKKKNDLKLKQKEELLQKINSAFSHISNVSREDGNRNPIKKSQIEDSLDKLLKDIEKVKSSTSIIEVDLKLQIELLLQSASISYMKQYKNLLDQLVTSLQGGESKNIAKSATELLNFDKSLNSNCLIDSRKILSSGQKINVIQNFDDLKKTGKNALWEAVNLRKGKINIFVERAKNDANSIIWNFDPSLEQQVQSLSNIEKSVLPKAKLTPQEFKNLSKINSKITSKAQVIATSHPSERQESILKSSQKLSENIKSWENSPSEKDSEYIKNLENLLNTIKEQTFCQPLSSARDSSHSLDLVKSSLNQGNLIDLKFSTKQLANNLIEFKKLVEPYLPSDEKEHVSSEIEYLNRDIIEQAIQVLSNPSQQRTLKNDLHRLSEVLDEISKDLRPPISRVARQQHAVLKSKRSFSSFQTPEKEKKKETLNLEVSLGNVPSKDRSEIQVGLGQTRSKSQDLLSPPTLVTEATILQQVYDQLKKAIGETNQQTLITAVTSVGVEMYHLEIQQALDGIIKGLNEADQNIQADKLQEAAKGINEISNLHQSIINSVNSLGQFSAIHQKAIFPQCQNLVSNSNLIVQSAQKVLNREPNTKQVFTQTIKTTYPDYVGLLSSVGYPKPLEVSKVLPDILTIKALCTPTSNAPKTAPQILQNVEKLLQAFTPSSAPQPFQQTQENPKPASNNKFQQQPFPLEGPDVPTLLQQLEQTQPSKKPEPLENINESQILSAIEDLLKPKEKPLPLSITKKSKNQKKIIKEGTTFEENLNHIANFVSEESAANITAQEGPQPNPETIPQFCEAIGQILKKIGENANNRQILIQKGKEISTISTTLDKFVRNLAGLVSDKRLQDILIRSSEAIRNYATQLKILSAVVAASTDSSNDHRFIQMARNFAYAIAQLLDANSELELRSSSHKH